MGEVVDDEKEICYLMYDDIDSATRVRKSFHDGRNGMEQNSFDGVRLDAVKISPLLLRYEWLIIW